ncbi:MAG: DUF2079 domain-containing protein [Lachnospiraceae bacterium]|nr:DUF2079 domain-containing protein [Lachnospiraceae bacterium]
MQDNKQNIIENTDETTNKIANESVNAKSLAVLIQENKEKIFEGGTISLIIGTVLSNLINKTYKPIENLEYMKNENIGSLFIIIILLSLAAGVLYFYSQTAVRCLLPLSIFVYSILTINQNKTTLPITIACIIGTVLAIAYVKNDLFMIISKVKISQKVGLIICAVLGVMLIVFLSSIGCNRYRTFSNSTYDFGIFAQMFENMKHTLRPFTSVERPEIGQYSHFGVHFSLIYYLVLPIYFVFSSPETIQIIQAVVLGLAVIPLYYLCEHYKLSRKMSVAVCAIYCLFPAVAGGTYYDFHENCFLPLALFCVVLALEKKHTVGIILSVMMLLMIKEDTPIVLLSIGLFLILSSKDIKRGSVVSGVSLAYFAIAMKAIKAIGTHYIDMAGGQVNGNGENAIIQVMHFSNLVYDSSKGASQIAVTIPNNIAYMLGQMSDTEKLQYLLLMILPLSIALVQKKKYSRYILLTAFVIINVLPSYVYMHDINFQYNYCAIAMMMYIAIMTVSEWDNEKKKTWALISVVMTFMLFVGFAYPTYDRYHERYKESKDYFVEIQNAIDMVPSDATVAVSGFMMPHLYKNKDVTVIQDNVVIDQDYVVVDCRAGYSEDSQKVAPYVSENYDLISEVQDAIAIYKRR